MYPKKKVIQFSNCNHFSKCSVPLWNGIAYTGSCLTRKNLIRVDLVVSNTLAYCYLSLTRNIFMTVCLSPPLLQHFHVIKMTFFWNDKRHWTWLKIATFTKNKAKALLSFLTFFHTFWHLIFARCSNEHFLPIT